MKGMPILVVRASLPPLSSTSSVPARDLCAVPACALGRAVSQNGRFLAPDTSSQCLEQSHVEFLRSGSLLSRAKSSVRFKGSEEREHHVQVSPVRISACATGGQGTEREGWGEVVQLKIAVGPTKNCSEKTFPFRRILGPSSVLVVVTLPKPLGIVFEAVKRLNKERVSVAELVQGSHAERASRVAQMWQSNTKSPRSNVIIGGDVRPGDILRATTTVGVVVDLFGVRAPRRMFTLYKADGRCWDDTMAALSASFVADGPLTLVLEREAIV